MYRNRAMRAFFASYLLWVTLNTLNSVNNPSNRVANNSCCVCCEVEGSCNNTCDIYLRLCLRPAGFDHSNTSCPLLELSSRSGQKGINLALPGPWPGSIQLYIRATHIVGDPDDEQDLTDNQLIDNMYIEIDNLTSFSPRTPMEEYRGDNGLLEARIQFEVNCDTDRYGPYCDVECHGRNDSEGHYLCNQNGDWECLEGYQNLETNCTECVAANGCINGYCDGPLNCMCMEGWSGDLCTECIPSEGCSPSGGYCLLPGQCLCNDGYSGDNCTIAPTTTADTVTSTTVTTPEATTLPTTPSLMSSPTTSFTPESMNLPSTDRVTLAPTLTSETTFLVPTVGGVILAPSTDRVTLAPTLTSETTFLVPTVGGVIPAPLTKDMIYLPIIIVAAAGGLLLLLIIIIGIVTLTATLGHRGITRHGKGGLLGRVYEISTAEPDTNRILQTAADEDGLFASSSPVSSNNDMTFTTFRNANVSPEQSTRGGAMELHVYYHRNTPEPPSLVGAMEGEREASPAESEPGMQCAEMDFPSEYNDTSPEERKDSYLRWSSMKSNGKSEHLSRSDSEGELNSTATGIHSSFNDYQFN